MAKLIGRAVWWSISDEVNTTAEILQRHGFGESAPRNENRTALIKACKKVKADISFEKSIGDDLTFSESAAVPRTLRASHVRFHENQIECKIALVIPKVSRDGLKFNQALHITVDKTSGNLSFSAPEGEIDQDLCDKIREEYQKGRVTVDSDQFRTLVARHILNKCYGRSLRAFSGGIYFIPECKNGEVEKIAALVGEFNPRAKFGQLMIYDDPTTLSTVDTEIAESFEKQIEGFLKELEGLSKQPTSARMYENRIQDAEEIMNQIRAYEDRLHSRAKEFAVKSAKMAQVLNDRLSAATGKTVEPFDLLASLEAIKDE